MPRNLFSTASKEQILFRNEQYLYPEFVPDTLPHRDAEIDTLVYALNPVLRGGKPNNLFVYGPTGVGKSVCIKRVLDDLEEHSDRAKSLYLNCFEFESRHAILTQITNFLGMPVPRRGIATDETYTKLLEAMKKIDFTPILVLDEADQLVDSTETSKLLYDLLRIVQYQKARFGLVIVSNDATFTSKLDARVRSSLAAESLCFSPYTSQQLKAILQERADRAFHPEALDKEIVGVAAAHAGKMGGDARIGIESLWKAGREAERSNSSKIRITDLKKAFEIIDAVPVAKIVKHLNEQERVLLKLITDTDKILSGDLYQKYSLSTKNPLTQRRVREFLSQLERNNLIYAPIISLGNKGKTKEISLKVSKEVLLREMEASRK